MKIGDERKEQDGHLVGYAFGWFSEYSLAAVYLDEVDFGSDDHDGSYDEEWIETDQDDYESVVAWSLHEKILIDVFQNEVCKDLFLCCLKQLMSEQRLDADYEKILSDWYFSEHPKFEVCLT